VACFSLISEASFTVSILFFFSTVQAELPFASKPKQQAPRKKASYLSQRSVILEPGERRAYTLLQQVATMRNVKDAKAAATAVAKKAEHNKKLEREAAYWKDAGKEGRKRKHAMQGLKDAKVARKAAGIDTGMN
jgi:ribosome biogenesis protein BMS1